MATVTFDHVFKQVRRRDRRIGPQPRDRRRRVHGARRPVGLRQDDQPADDRRARGDHARARSASATGSSTTSPPRTATSRWCSRATRSTRTCRSATTSRSASSCARSPRPRSRSGSTRRPGSSQLEKLLDRKPKELSGGQRQRVALGRAIVREPAVFLMDEPLSNLDAKLRVQTRAEIARLHQRLGTTIVYVTHDQVEAMTMGQRIAVMSEGLLQQVGTPAGALRHADQPVRGRLHRQPVDELRRARQPRRRRDRAQHGRRSTFPLPDELPRGARGRAGDKVDRGLPAGAPRARRHAGLARRRSRARPTWSSTSATRSCSTSRSTATRSSRSSTRRTGSARATSSSSSCRSTSCTCSTPRLRALDRPAARGAPPRLTSPSIRSIRRPARPRTGRPLHVRSPRAPTTPIDATRSRSASSSREVVHRGRYLEFRVDTIERADGSTRHARRRRPSGRGRRARARRRRPAADGPPVARARRAGAARDPGRHARRPRRRHRGPRRRRAARARGGDRPPGGVVAQARRRSGRRPGSRRS